MLTLDRDLINNEIEQESVKEIKYLELVVYSNLHFKKHFDMNFKKNLYEDSIFQKNKKKRYMNRAVKLYNYIKQPHFEY